MCNTRMEEGTLTKEKLHSKILKNIIGGFKDIVTRFQFLTYHTAVCIEASLQ